ncbi:Interleukin-6 receptor subunit alpha [Dissostichus eleginoides]|uniref:Interleukin-6 receptor subunit alpha n=1 Tax=Dissostichus eleginoides TaxID=100907 RepID=A0AAD9C3I5_DISEL|nr:Interleukin-6 receptor subunit alpha [Dissostichus eleginoides]
MRIFLPLLCALCATPVHGIFDGTCPKKDPPPGVLVLSPGSKLVLSCSGHVEADGVKVRVGSSSDENRTSVNNISNPEALMKSAKPTVENTVVRLSDSGRFTCYHRGRERFSLKVKVADPPETPQLSCYKKSPSSKIRCEWAPQKPFTIFPNCSLFLSKSATKSFLHLQCTYSSKHSRCWCALDHNDDELRSNYMAYLCVTSMAGNTTSSLLSFMPLSILKPDPPSGVSVRQEEGQEMRMTVTWSLPITWKSQDSFYKLIYEIKYRPLKSFDHWQLRTREEYDGQWSDWSTPLYESSWTAKRSVEYEDLTATTFSVYTEGSGADEDLSDVPEPVQGGDEGPHHILWISCGSFAFLSVILALFIFRHRDRFMSKLKSMSVSIPYGDSPRPAPSAQTPPEGHALDVRDVLLKRPVDIRDFAADHFTNPDLHVLIGSKMEGNME